MAPPMGAQPGSIAELDAIARDALVALALQDEPWLSRTAWKDQATRAGIVDPRGRQLTGEAFEEVVRVLTEEGAVVLVGNGGYALALR